MKAVQDTQVGMGMEFVKNVSRSLSAVRMPQSLDNHTRVTTLDSDKKYAKNNPNFCDHC